MGSKFFVFSLAFILAISLTAQEKANDKILFTDKAASHRQTTSFVKAGSEAGMDFLTVSPEKNDSTVYAVALGAGGNENWRNCEIDFKFRFPENIENFTVTVGDAADPKKPNRKILSYCRAGLWDSPTMRSWSAYFPGFKLKEKTW